MNKSALRNYIGLANTLHDSALAIVNSRGAVVFAEATERPMQYKRALNISADVIHHTGDLVDTFCEHDAEIVVASSWRAEMEQEWTAQLRSLKVDPHNVAARFGTPIEEFALRSGIRSVAFAGLSVDYELMRVGWPKGIAREARTYPHHLTHAATACFTSPFEEAVCAVSDGFGEDSSIAFFFYKNGKLHELPTPTPKGTESLGLFFLEVCGLCGFSLLSGEEWKVMGLAAHGTRDMELETLFHKLIQVDGLSIVSCSTTEELAEARRILESKRRRPGVPVINGANIAHAGQNVFCDLSIKLLNNLYEVHPHDNLVVSGGCALNSSCNGKILESTPFKRLHVFSAPGDDGNAVGAALLAYYQDNPNSKPAPGFQSPYLGSRMESETLLNVRRFNSTPKIHECDNPSRLAASKLASGQVIGWIQGRAEFGPRALGNRSILADPRPVTIKDHINSRVKFREEFRPFAPAILHEFGPEYFENYQESPYMERTLLFKPSAAKRVPGVVHEDGTGRLQSVRREWNEQFYSLIYAFYELTGIPIVLNTSFNVMGKPISHSVEDAIAVFYTTGLDALFIDKIVLEK